MNVLVAIGAALLGLAAPHGARVRHDMAYGAGERGRLDVYQPRNATSAAPLAVFVYGGSWQSGDKRLYRFVGQLLAARGIVTVIPDYRIYPEVRYPSFLRDNAAAVKFAKAHALDWGADPRRLVLVGHSAGAYNVAMLTLDRRWLVEAGLDPRRDLAGMVGLSGPYDFLPLRDATLKVIFGPEPERPDTQPITHVDGESPPLLLLAGDRDRVVDPGNTTRLAARVAARGGKVIARILPGKSHLGLLTGLLRPFGGGTPLLDEVVTFIEQLPPAA